MMRAPLGLGVLLVTAVGVSEAAVLRVPSEYPTIQAGIDASVDGDTVLVAPGRYSGTGNARLAIRKPITLLCEQGPLTCVIDSEGSRSNPGYGIGIGTDSEASVIVDGFTITGGYGHSGMAGAIACGGDSNVEIRNCVISENTAYGGGGGVRIAGSDRTHVTLSNCIITGNRCIGERSIGGGVFCDGAVPRWRRTEYSRVVLRNCVVAGNQAAFGGGAN